MDSEGDSGGVGEDSGDHSPPEISKPGMGEARSKSFDAIFLLSVTVILVLFTAFLLFLKPG